MSSFYFIFCVLCFVVFFFKIRHLIFCFNSRNALFYIIIIRYLPYLFRVIQSSINAILFYWSVNFFRHTIHSKSTVVNLAEPSWNAFGKYVSSSVLQSIVTGNLLRRPPPFVCYVFIVLFYYNYYENINYNNSSYISSVYELEINCYGYAIILIIL